MGSQGSTISPSIVPTQSSSPDSKKKIDLSYEADFARHQTVRVREILPVGGEKWQQDNWKYMVRRRFLLACFFTKAKLPSLWTISERSPPSPLETPPTTLSPQLSPVEGRRLQHQFVWKSRMPAAAYDLRPPSCVIGRSVAAVLGRRPQHLSASAFARPVFFLLSPYGEDYGHPLPPWSSMETTGCVCSLPCHHAF